MAISDLSFYQSYLRNMGIKYILSEQRAITHTNTCPGRQNHHQNISDYPTAMLFKDSKIVVDPGHKIEVSKDIPAILSEYRRPAYSVWSYYDLPQDIEKGFTNPRCDLIFKIIGTLKWGRKMYTFWPLSSLDRSSIVPDPELFFHGISLIKPAYIFIFGSKAFKTLFKDREYTYGQHYSNNQQIIALPDLDSLLPDNRILKTMVWNILKKYTPPQY